MPKFAKQFCIFILLFMGSRLFDKIVHNTPHPPSKQAHIQRVYDHTKDWPRFYNLVVSQDIKLPKQAVIESATENYKPNGGSYQVQLRLPKTHSWQQWIQAIAHVSHLPLDENYKNSITYFTPDGSYMLSLVYNDEARTYYLSCDWQGPHKPSGTQPRT